ncbi:hypothetical protein [Moritella sp. F3]|uniref:hypothetical protein n=1 Tax=Moritella sp. F3 TaxID=2718882 RepID=UPI0018E1D1BC|nr:hypothetical protein [Moritella sp. F3]GIC78866.1 hypothetical protein FMO001_35930 [Moritella sp. F1]GIC81899.1 hypothetical protein FMO003_21800 [Moritella sp. F3]
MKRILITGALLAAAATAGYLVSQNTGSNEYTVLNYIPENTPLFSGQLTPFPIKTYLNAIADTYSTPPDEMMGSIYASESYDPENNKVNFFLALTQRYLDSMQDTDTFMTTFGLADELQAYFYTLGIMPVFKMDVVNPDAIWALLDEAEAESGFIHELRQIKQRDYRAYQLTDDSDKVNLELIISQYNNLLTITLNSGLNDLLLLENALGLTPVEQSLADSDSLEQLIKKHDFTEQSIGYLNHQAIIQAITSPNESLLGQHIAQLMALQTEDPLQVYQQPQCKAELTSIANNWPRTVFGFKQFDINDDNVTFDMSMVIESNNQTILSALTQMTGFIPEYVSDLNNTVLALGIGIDVGSLSPAISSVWNELQQPSYTCPPLQQAQSTIQQNNPAMLGVMTAMANGIKGVSGAVIDYSLDENQSELAIKSLDAIISLSANDPRALYNIIATFRPELAGVKLPANGSIVELSSLIPISSLPGVNPKLLMHKEHMVIFNGDKAEKIALDLGNKPMTATGIYSLSIDYSKAFTPLVTAAELSGQEVPQELKDMKDYNLRLNTGLQINEHGIETRSYVDLKSN